jgi:hypothetical protein
MKLFSGLITILFALLISATAAWFSVAGLVALFAATAIPVMIMGTVLESSKLVAAGWLHSNWKNPNVTFIHKAYLTIAVIALMIITSIGIYGFLSKGHLEQAAPLAGVELQINAKQQQIQMLQDSNTRLQQEQKQLDDGVSAFLQGGSLRGAQAGLKARGRQSSERANIQKQMDANNAQIEKLDADILPLKQQTVEVEAKLGPVKYVAQLFGWQDTDKAVRLVILTIMVAFDPLAVILLISATISLGEWAEERAAKKTKQETTQKPVDQARLPVGFEIDTEFPRNEDLRVVSPSMAYAPGFTGNENGVPVRVEETPSEPFVEPTIVTEEQKTIRADLEDMNSRLATVAEVAEVIDATEPETEQDQTHNDEDKLDAMRAADPIAPETAAKEVPAETVNDVTIPVIEKAPNDKERLIEILEKRPEILQDLIDVISSHRQQEEAKTEPKVEETPTVEEVAQPVVEAAPSKVGPKPWL